MEKTRFAIIETMEHASVSQFVLAATMNADIPILIIDNKPEPIPIKALHIDIIEICKISQPTKKQAKNFNKQQIKKGWKRK